MSYCNEGTNTTMLVSPAGYGGGMSGGFAGGMFGDWVWLIVILALVWGGNGWGNNTGGSGGVVYDTGAAMQRGFDTQTIIGKLDGLNSGICSLGYDQLSQMSAINSNISAVGNNAERLANGTNLTLTQAQNALQNLVSRCCCDIRESISDANYNAAMNANAMQNAIQANTTQGVMNTNAIQQQIQQCCCDNEKAAMQSRFDAQQYNCATLQAIDKLGDRIIDWLTQDKAQTLRDENQALRLAASQQAQNAYLLSQLRPNTAA